MASLIESTQWEASIYQFETTDPVKGGNDGISNLQGKQLANRTAYLKQQVELKAPLASPTFTGTPAVPTAVADTSTTQVASTAFVVGQAATVDPIIDGVAAVGTSKKFARQDHVHPTDTTRAPVASPTFTGVPAVPTAVADTSTTQAASTAFVIGQAATVAPIIDGVAAVGTSKKFARQDHVHPTDETRVSIENLQKGTHIFAVETGVANAYVCNFNPALDGRGEGQVIRFKVANANTGISTFNDGAGVVPLVGGAHSALQGGELIAGGDAWVQWNSTVGTGSYVLLLCTSGAEQITSGSKSQHAATIGQVPSVSGVSSGLSISYPGTSGLVTVAATAIALVDANKTCKTLRNLSVSATSGALTGTANGLDTGSWAYSTIYHLFVIHNPTTSATALLWSLSSTSPILPSGFTFYARIGANKTQSATNYWFLSGLQMGNKFQYLIISGGNLSGYPVLASGAQGSVTTPTWVSVSLSGHVPATARAVDAMIKISTTTTRIIVAPTNAYGAYTSFINPPPLQIDIMQAGNLYTTQSKMIAISSLMLYYASSDSNGSLYATGWEDNL